MFAKSNIESQRRITDASLARKQSASTAEIVDASVAGDPYRHSVAIFDRRILTRECLAQSLKACDPGLKIVAAGSMEEWQGVADRHPPLGAILLNTADKPLTHEAIGEIGGLVSAVDPVPVLLLADSEELEQIALALECGVKGYIPSSVGIAVCAGAIRLAMVGGRYVPPSSVLAMRSYIRQKTRSARPLSSMFTQRQSEVVQALRRGKANKIIAYELDMRESTVKVHVRNIMKKVKATNRTEVAYKINEMFPENA